MDKKLSIIMPAYNVEKYVGKAISSILSQDYKNLELLIVDDGSTDETAKIAKRYSANDVRAIVLSKQNGGLSDARNYGLERATGDYVLFVDSDDFIEPNTIGKLMKYSNDRALDVCIFGYYYDIYEHEKTHTEKVVVEPGKIITRGSKRTKIANASMLGYAWNKLYDRRFLSVNNIIFERGLSYIEDIIFNEQVYRHAKKVGFYDQPIYHYVQYGRTTLGKTYHKKIAQYDRRSIQAFCNAMKVLGVSNYDVRMFRIKNTVDRTRWSIDIIANTTAVNRQEKIRSLCELRSNIQTIPQEAGSSVDRMLLGLLRHERFNLLLLLSSAKTRNIVRFIKDSISPKLKNWIIYHKSSTDNYQNLSKKDKKIIIMLAADYGNLGDIAIAYAQNKFLKDNFPDRTIVVVPISQTYRKIKSLKKKMNKDDIVTITGGGNMSDMYEDIEEQRRFVIKKFPNNRIISFPQTISFSHTEVGENELTKTQSIYNAHGNLTIFARERKSYKAMKRLFHKCRVLLAPDIVLYLNKLDQQKQRDTNKLIICLRDDEEVASSAARRAVSDIIKRYPHVLSLDTVINANKISPQKGRRELQWLWGQFASAGLVVTDRLHGMIFCAITNTPCIALNNSNRKVQGVFNEWIKGGYPIMFAQTKASVQASVADIIKQQTKTPHQPFHILKKSIE